MKKVMKGICGLITAICFFGMLFFACGLDSPSNMPWVLTVACAVGMVLFGIPAGAFSDVEE